MATAASEAHEIVGDPETDDLFVFTCEHASNRLPEWIAEPADEPILADHWGWDIGAADLTRRLVASRGAAGVLSRFSRLVCDPNRTVDDPTFVVTHVEGHALSFNRACDDAERARRARVYYDGYHGAIDALLRDRRDRGVPTLLCSVHSFTPTYRGAARAMEVGVLFDAHEPLAGALVDGLRGAGFVTAPNEPYSGYAGMMHAAHRHGRDNRIPYLEIEVRQDLIETPDRAEAVADRIAPALARLEAWA